jgi:G3E family GTPase
MVRRTGVEPPPAAPVDLIILAGFLGSGKTSLLVDFLQSDAAGDTGVIVNEAGEIGIDGAIVADSAAGVPMTLLANGCVCCSLRSSLVDTVNALLEAPRPDGRGPLTRIVLETSGLSRPGPIIASLADPELARRNLRLSVLTTYDCESDPARATQFEEAAAQFAGAERIVLTKVDKVPADALAGHIARARGFNHLAQIVADSDRAAAVRGAFAALPGAQAGDLALRALFEAGRGEAALPHPRIRVWAGTPRAAMDWDDFSMWLDDLAGFCGERLLRVKALLKVSDCAEPILIQSVGTTFGMPRRMAAPDGRDVLVVITRDLELADLQSMAPDGPVSLQALS